MAGSRVDVSFGEIFDTDVSGVLVSPANSFGFMDGGIDAIYLQRFGFALQDRVRAAIEKEHAGELPVGSAILVDTDDAQFPTLIVAPTMRIPGDVSGTVNAYLAMRAALSAASRAALGSVVCPGLGTAVGAMDPMLAARQMRMAWDNIIDGHRHESLEAARRSQGRCAACVGRSTRRGERGPISATASPTPRRGRRDGENACGRRRTPRPLLDMRGVHDCVR